MGFPDRFTKLGPASSPVSPVALAETAFGGKLLAECSANLRRIWRERRIHFQRCEGRIQRIRRCGAPRSHTTGAARRLYLPLSNI